MFILYALVIGVALGLALGGRPAGLGRLRFRWSGVMLAGLLVQVVLFSDTVAERIGALGPPIYVASTVLVLAAVVANRSIPGMAIVALGAVSNLAAIVANGGYMPAARSALDALGKSDPTTYSNSTSVENPALGPLTDIFAMPPVAALRERVQRRRRPHRRRCRDDDRPGDAVCRSGWRRGQGCPRATPPSSGPAQYGRVTGPAAPPAAPSQSRDARPPANRIVQGKPVARRGRKARDLSSETARLPILRASTLR